MENNTEPIRIHLNFDTLYEEKVQACKLLLLAAGLLGERLHQRSLLLSGGRLVPDWLSRREAAGRRPR